MEHSISSKLPCIVADSAAFIRNVDLQNLSERIFTIGEVINEIKDTATKQRLAVLPYEIEFREPSAESLKNVTEFSKKTGDFKSLSAVDLKVIALTYHLEKEFCDVNHIRNEPTKKCIVVPKTKVSDKEMGGFYIEKKATTKTALKQKDINNDINKEPQNNELGEEPIKAPPDSSEDNFVENINNNDDNIDDNGWITPGNIEKIKEQMVIDDEVRLEDANVKCACLTTDFAMQNVLIQMGLHVVSVNGMIIRHARNYIQKCYGCYKETHNMEEVFCPSCGNKTLLKIAVTIDSDGTVQYHYPKRRGNFNIRGTKFSIPIPKSGRHNTDDVVLCADQHIKLDRLPKRKDKVNPLDPDYESRVSPFSKNDTTSRAFIVGAHVKHSKGRNPNESKKKNHKK